MNNIEELKNELLTISTNISSYSNIIQREQGELTKTMNKVSSIFGDQPSGQELVTILYTSLQKLIYADSSLNIVRQEINDCIQNIQK